MEYITLKNFRRFKELPKLNLGNVTFLVGTNNSGKSSLTKAIMLALKNLKGTSRNSVNARPAFYFDITDANVGSFERALNKDALPVDKYFYEIVFEFSINDVEFSYTVNSQMRERKSSTAVDISSIKINDTSNRVVYEFNYVDSVMSIVFKHKIKENEKQVAETQKSIDEYESAIRVMDEMSKRGNNVSQTMLRQSKTKLDKLKNDLYLLKETAQSVDKEEIIVLPIEGQKCNPNTETLITLVKSFIEYANTETPMGEDFDTINQQNLYEEEEKRKTILKANSNTIGKSVNDIIEIVENDHYVYIPSHLATQKVILIPDKNDYNAKVARDFKRMGIRPTHSLFTTWMDKDHFNLGTGFKVTPERGEAYSIQLTTFNGKEIDLAETGRGSVQLMILLLKLGIIIQKYGEKKSTPKPIIIIEEPEQNLHPKMQSRLADLFLYMNEKYGYQFLIETHSEYLIRKSQVLVARKGYKSEKDLAKNPFTVYYFRDSLTAEPYFKMKYRTDGKFENEFESGFFDEASNLAFEIF